MVRDRKARAVAIGESRVRFSVNISVGFPIVGWIKIRVRVRVQVRARS